MAADTRLVFAHANGFPAATYRQLLDAWRGAGLGVLAPAQLGHDARFPVGDEWLGLRDELVDFVAREAEGGSVWLVGHSLGGYLVAMAASHRPGLARGVVLLDAPIVGGLLGHGLGLLRAAGLGGRFSPGRVSQRRRERWPSAEAALAHFAAKPAFARWAPGVLADYVACGVRPAGEAEAAAAAHSLAFRREVETAIYDSLPLGLDRRLRLHPPRCPLAIVCGRESREVRQVGLRATLRHAHGRVAWINGTHLFPFERPRETAEAVLGWLRAFAADELHA